MNSFDQFYNDNANGVRKLQAKISDLYLPSANVSEDKKIF